MRSQAGWHEAASEYTLFVSGCIYVRGEWEIAVTEGLEGWWNKAILKLLKLLKAGFYSFLVITTAQSKQLVCKSLTINCEQRVPQSWCHGFSTVGHRPWRACHRCLFLLFSSRMPPFQLLLLLKEKQIFFPKFKVAPHQWLVIDHHWVAHSFGTSPFDPCPCFPALGSYLISKLFAVTRGTWYPALADTIIPGIIS